MKNWFTEKIKKYNAKNNDLERVEEYRQKYTNYIEHVERNVMGYDTVEVANHLIALIVEHLNYKQTIEALEHQQASMDNSRISDLFRYLSHEVGVEPPRIILREVHPDDESAYSQSIFKRGGEKEVEINAIPILLNVWKGDRVIDNFQSINENNKFDGLKYKNNIQNHYLYPMNFVVCFGGNHSQFAARYKNEGRTVVEEIADYSNIYSVITFDGIGFLDKNNEYLELDYSEDEVFYAGLLYELGRYILDNTYFDQSIPRGLFK